MWYEKAWSLTCRICPPTITHLTGGKVQVQFYGVPGQKYAVQASTDVTTRTPLGTVTVGSNGMGIYVV